MQNGFDQPLTKAVRDAVNIPVIASGEREKLNTSLRFFRTQMLHLLLRCFILEL